jgi:hypothetical protein
VSQESSRDPREVLAREKFFTLRPQPLERWLWRRGVPQSAERVFWLHWQAGQRNGDWCSAIPLKTVAAECSLDVSTVTRAYQILAELGVIRRQDPGRDPERPFQQAVAITEVRVPRELVQELDRYPNRASREAPVAGPVSPTPTAPYTTPEPSRSSSPAVADPFLGLSGRERMRALGALLGRMTPCERHQYDEALRNHCTHVTFDTNSRLTPDERGQVLQLLAIMGRRPAAPVPSAPAVCARPESHEPRRLSVLELARLRRELQAIAGSTEVEDLLREVVWSVEEGALRRFTSLHAVRIALKKIREGLWTRPNRMPPQWARALTRPAGSMTRGSAAPEPCRAA